MYEALVPRTVFLFNVSIYQQPSRAQISNKHWHYWTCGHNWWGKYSAFLKTPFSLNTENQICVKYSLLAHIRRHNGLTLCPSLLPKQTVNVPDAYLDSRFDPKVDEDKEFKHKSILCMAIKNSLSQIIGVIQLVNKFGNLVSAGGRNGRSAIFVCETWWFSFAIESLRHRWSRSNGFSQLL